MDGIKEYILSILAAAIVCAIVKYVPGEKSTTGKLLKVVSGVFMAVTLISPLVNIKLDDFESYFAEYNIAAEKISAEGAEMAGEAMADIIKQRSEAYILDEANALGLDINVEVTLSDSDPPAPYKVMITGTASPYNKNILSQFISNSLGVTQENQQWT